MAFKKIEAQQLQGNPFEMIEKQAALFTAGTPGDFNTMTIGWGWIGWCWKRPVFAAVVRPQRFTHDILERTGEFTVSVPTLLPLKKELAYAGNRSGRDENKFVGHGLTALPGQKVDAPIVGECGLHYECRVVLTQEMTEDRMAPEVLRTAYPRRDLHTIYFGEILTCYRIDEQ